MLPGVSERGARRLGESGGLKGLIGVLVKNGPDALKASLGGAVPGRDVQSAVRVVMNLPRVTVECTVVGAKGGPLAAGADVEAQIKTTQDNCYKRGFKASVKAGMKAREEGWWLVLGFEDVDELVAIKRIKVGGQTGSQTVSFKAPQKRGDHELCVTLVSDCYLGLDTHCKTIFSVGGGGGGGAAHGEGAGMGQAMAAGANVGGGSGPGVGPPVFKH